MKHLMDMGKFIDYKQDLKIEDKTFQKLMFLYSIAIKEMETKIEILKDEFKILHDYELINHVISRIKEPQSIVNKMQKRNLELTYQNMVENVNDIAGIRIICPLKKDVFSVKDVLQKMSNIQVLKEKDYITYPKKSGYSSYHLIVEVPINLSQMDIYVKVEIQIRTMAMDFWATNEHDVRYKTSKKLSFFDSKKLYFYAKVINLLDNKMMKIVQKQR